MWECVCKDMGRRGPICEQCQSSKQVCSYQIEWKEMWKKKKGKSTLAPDFGKFREEFEEFQEEVKTELAGIREEMEEMEEMRIALTRGMKKTRDEMWAILQDSLAEMTGMFTSLVDEVKDQGERNRAQLESHLNLDEEDEVMGSGDNLIDFMD